MALPASVAVVIQENKGSQHAMSCTSLSQNITSSSPSTQKHIEGFVSKFDVPRILERFSITQRTEKQTTGRAA